MIDTAIVLFAFPTEMAVMAWTGLIMAFLKWRNPNGDLERRLYDHHRPWYFAFKYTKLFVWLVFIYHVSFFVRKGMRSYIEKHKHLLKN